MTDAAQTVSFSESSSNHSVAFKQTDNGNGITVIIGSDGAASIGALSLKDKQDTFTLDDITYEMLDNGSILRVDSNTYWTHGTLKDNTALAVSDLQNEDYWGGAVKISNGILNITKNIMENYNSVYVIDVDNASKVYGTLIKSSDATSYTLDGSTAGEDATLNQIIFSTDAQPVSLSSVYGGVQLTAGDTDFLAKNSSDGFTVNYTSDSLSTDATAVSLLGGSWTLTDNDQTLTADGQTIQTGGSSTNIFVNYDGSSAVSIGGIDAAGEIVNLNGTNYQLNSADGGGFSVDIEDNVASINGISDEDNFKIGDDTFIKKDAGFVKTNSKNNSFLWINSSDVTGGVAVDSLSGNDTVG